MYSKVLSTRVGLIYKLLHIMYTYTKLLCIIYLSKHENEETYFHYIFVPSFGFVSKCLHSIRNLLSRILDYFWKYKVCLLPRHQQRPWQKMPGSFCFDFYYIELPQRLELPRNQRFLNFFYYLETQPGILRCGCYSSFV